MRRFAIPGLLAAVSLLASALSAAAAPAGGQLGPHGGSFRTFRYAADHAGVSPEDTGLCQLRHLHVLPPRRVLALDAATCEVLWFWANREVLGASPAVIGATAYFASWDKRLYAFRLP